MPAYYIPDGYTVDAVIPALADHWGDIPITFRPTVDDEVERLVAGKISGAKLLSEKVVKLGIKILTNPADPYTAVDFTPTEDNFRHLWAKLRNRVIDMVCDFTDGYVQGKPIKASDDAKN